MNDQTSNDIEILLIEDNECDAEIFSRHVKKIPDFSCRVVVVGTLAQAERALRRVVPDIIFSDLGLPDSQGIQSLENLVEVNSDVPIVILSGTDDVSILLEASHLGIQDYLVKGDITSGILKRCIRYAIERKNFQARTSEFERQLFQADKMKTIERLVGGVAHDFNNKLAVMLGNLESVKNDLGAEHKLVSHLEVIESAIHNGADLTRQLLAFGCKQELSPCVLDVHRTLKESVKSFEPLSGINVETELLSEEGGEYIKIDPVQFLQIITNLVNNSREAMPNGGVIKLYSEEIFLKKKQLGEFPDSDGKFVQIKISDSGSGMDESTLSHVFEPFFSTRDVALATGLGLSSVQGIVKQSGGHISIASEVGSGTEVLLTFKREEQPEEIAELNGNSSPEKVMGTILYAEDEELLQEITVLNLETVGYRIIRASDGAEAFKLFEDSLSENFDGSYKIDLVLTDVIMPNLNGKELAKLIWQRTPEMNILFMSGYSRSEIMKDDEGMKKNTAFLSKPVSTEELHEVIQQMLKINNSQVKRAA